MQVRYVHLRQAGLLAAGGMTFRIVGDPSQVGTVEVQHAECSLRDNYCKETGRVTAASAKVTVVPLRKLSAHLREKAKDYERRRETYLNNSSFDYVINAFLPKE